METVEEERAGRPDPTRDVAAKPPPAPEFWLPSPLHTDRHFPSPSLAHVKLKEAAPP